MTPYYETPSTSLYVGDCRDVLAEMDAASVDACVCDPPYDLTDVGRRFPGTGGSIDPRTGRVRSESRRGGFMGAKWDATGVAFDPATWEAVKRVLKPGSYLVAFGGTRTWHRMATAIEDAGFEIKDCLCWLYGSGMPKHKSLLKPAWEPIVLAKKRGQGSINRDACRIGDVSTVATHRADIGYGGGLKAAGKGYTTGSENGRVPANVILDDVAAAMLDEQTGTLTSGKLKAGQVVAPEGCDILGARKSYVKDRNFGGDSGGASRFFYCAKADDTERNRGLPVGMENDHPTVKPVSLVQWLVRLVARPGQMLVDPFMGSGTTGIGCNREGVMFRGIDLSEHYAEIAKYRITGDAPLFANLLTA